jgi:hypothetical protein
VIIATATAGAVIVVIAGTGWRIVTTIVVVVGRTSVLFGWVLSLISLVISLSVLLSFVAVVSVRVTFVITVAGVT